MEGSLKETSYEKRIQRLMTGEDGDQYGFYINITDNIVREVKNPEKACWEDETGRPGGVTHWLQKQIYPYILDNEEEKKFRRTFLKEELLRIFQTGQRHIQLGYRFRKGKYITCYTVNIEMFEHPVDHTVECCAIWRNDTTQIRLLNEEDSALEIARILGGAQITEHTMESAKEMKELARKKKEEI